VGEVQADQEFEERRCRRWLDAAQGYAEDRDVKVSTEIRTGHAAQELLRAAETLRADLLVLGHSGHSAVWGRFLGATAEKVSRHAHCSVLIAAPPEGRPQG
jgi:nucleotide-binding universal stress UspA family protein